ncbi:membrane-associated protein, putative [Bodo saltans]|uniref:Membrane-associated protein, putative n=1 Tax=Bodo saltans TaxID=75058 RepID=A0A0S4J5U5_BODSA|nr:membrane-associated protein, putative [Bodo saltans]|eukprot:CUG85634.1 membrane-associated protein, putative [Bodo saltans]
MFRVLLALVLVAAAVSGAEPTIRELLKQKFSVALVSDSYGTFRTKLELQPSVNFEESLSTIDVPALEGTTATTTPRWFETLRLIVDLKSPDGNSGNAQVFFVEATDGAANITFDFNLVKPSTSATFLESSGKYSTNTFAYGVFWWRFTSQSEFTLQFVDHIFSNTTTLQGSSLPLVAAEGAKSDKPWYQTWGLVLVTGGVFLIRLWLNNMQSRRQLKQEKIAEMNKKKQ